jgi:hypothetical protein
MARSLDRQNLMRAAHQQREPVEQRRGRVEVLSRDQLAACLHWRFAFSSQHKDHRYYEIVEDSLHPEFKYRYFVMRDGSDSIRGIQPFFVLDQDLLAGMSPRLAPAIEALRRRWPRFMRAKTLMVGCVAGEGHLDGGDAATWSANAELLAASIEQHARALGARLIVLKEFPRQYHDALSCFARHGFTAIPSMPMTRLHIGYASFDDYLRNGLNSDRRRKLRKKLAAAEQAAPIELSVTTDVSGIVDEVYPLYLQVYERSKLHFEKLTNAYFCRLGHSMPDRVRFFVWRQNGKAVAFGECIVHGDTLFAEYLGLDYAVAIELHLYHYVFRDLVRWAIANGCKWFQSSALSYDPKLHLGHRLVPIDLYVKHTSAVINPLLRTVLPMLEPTRWDATLKKFPNYAELRNAAVNSPMPGAG